MTQETELIKCKCGGEPKPPKYKYPCNLEWWQIECTRCMRFIGADTIEETIALWNKAMQPEDPSKADEWQPIETAPKDGTEVIVFLCMRSYVACQDNGRWFTHGEIFNIRPTHWKPLPTPPKENE